MNRALRAATVGVLLLSPVVLSACSAGQITQTGTQQRDKSGAQGQVGDIAVRAALLAFPDGGSYAAGDDAALNMAIANDGSQDDTLVDVSGTGFGGAVFTDATAAASSSASGTPAAGTTGTPPSGTSTTSASPTGTPTGTATTGTPAGSTTAASTSSSSAPAPTEIPVPAGQTVFVGQDDAHITLTGLDSSLTTGQVITVVLTFQRAGELTLKVTVANPSSTLDRGQNFDFNQTGG